MIEKKGNEKQWLIKEEGEKKGKISGVITVNRKAP